jgi:hypothetical protein
MVRVAGTLQKSTEVMKLVNDSMKLPVLRATMLGMSKGTSWVGGQEDSRREARCGGVGLFASAHVPEGCGR